MYTPIICVEPDSSERAACEGRNLSFLIARCTRLAVAGATEPLPLTTREAVPRPTPARRATSLIVAMRGENSMLTLKISGWYSRRRTLGTFPINWPARSPGGATGAGFPGVVMLLQVAHHALRNVASAPNDNRCCLARGRARARRGATRREATRGSDSLVDVWRRIAAVRRLADAYRAAGGVWVDTAVAGSEQARAVAINRVVGGNPPTAALFNTSKQFHDLVRRAAANVDASATGTAGTAAARPIRSVIQGRGPLLRGAGQTSTCRPGSGIPRRLFKKAGYRPRSPQR